MRCSGQSRWLVASLWAIQSSAGCTLRDIAGEVPGSAAASGGTETAGVEKQAAAMAGNATKVSSGGAPAAVASTAVGSEAHATATGGVAPKGGQDSGGAGGSSGSTVGGNTESPSGGSAGGANTSGTDGATPPPTLITSAVGAYWKETTWIGVSSGAADVTVNDNSESQTFTGFGGTFNEKGWEALLALSEADRSRALRLLFDPTEGARFVYGRIPIGANDFAVDRYSLDDTKGDYAMSAFTVERDRKKLIPYIKAALAVRADIRFWASPWTPPPWMKDNDAYDGGNMKGDAETLEAYALYLAKFVEAYGAEGITIQGIHPQNEPSYSQDYPSCVWAGAVMAKFIGTHLGPMFRNRNIRTDIFLGTMSNSDRGKDSSIIDAVTEDPTAMTYVTGYGLQWNMLDVYATLNMKRGLPVWQTEHKCGNYPWDRWTYQSVAPNDHAYGVESWGLIREWIKRGVNAYNAWNMVLDTVGMSLDAVRPWSQNALLTVDTARKTLNVTPAYYVFRHVSQFIDPGAMVVGTIGGDALAFKNPDGRLVVIMYNSGAATTYVVAVRGKMLQFSMPGNGWATLSWKS